MSGSSSGIGGDIMGGLQTVGGAVATIMGYPQLGLPLMTSGVGSLTGGSSGGGLGGLGSLITPAGTMFSGGSSGAPGFASPFSSNDPNAGAAPPASMGGIASPSMPPMIPPSASFGSPVAPPPVLANAAGGAGAAAPMSGNLTPAGGLAGLQASLNTPSALAGAPNLAGAGGQPTNTALALQDAGGVGQAYQQYLMQNQLLKYRPQYVGGHNSAVGSPQYNPLAPNQSSPINPPQLVV